MKTMVHGRQGFTLIELLVVLAVIGIMMAILLPAVMGALDKGKTTHCANNLAQIGKAIPQYAADNKDSLPELTSGTNTWDSSLLVYLGQTTNAFWCVADPYPVSTSDRLSYGANAGSGDCPFRRSGSGNKAAKLRDFEGIYQMGDLILVADLNMADAVKLPRIGKPPAQTVRYNRYPNIHTKGTGGNYLMASYAVRYYHKSDGAVTKKSGDPGNLWTFFAPPP